MATKKLVGKPDEVVSTNEEKKENAKKTVTPRVTVNGIEPSAALDRVHSLLAVDASINAATPVNRVLTNVFGWTRWLYDFDPEAGSGLLTIFDDCGAVLRQAKFPANGYREGLVGAFCTIFGYVIPNFCGKQVELPVKAKEPVKEAEIEENGFPWDNMTEETKMAAPPVVQKPATVPKGPITDGNNGKNGYYPSTSSLPDTFTGRVELLSAFQACLGKDKRTVTGYGAKVKVRNVSVALRYWFNQTYDEDTVNYLRGLNAGESFEARLKKYVVPNTGEVQLIFVGWAA